LKEGEDLNNACGTTETKVISKNTKEVK